MLKAALVAAAVFAASGSSLVVAQASPASARTVGAHAPVVTMAHIARLKNVLKLTAIQASHWPAVEAALRHIARQQAQSQELDSASVQRLMFAAMPLIQSLDEGQKRQAVSVARSMGFAQVASAL
jgi:hypothetical protein